MSYQTTYNSETGKYGKVWVNDEHIIQDPRPLPEVQSEKLAELSAACAAAINDGITLTTEDGVERHFAGDEQDQINIDQVLRACEGGAPGWLYQSEGSNGQAGDCFWCTAMDARRSTTAWPSTKPKNVPITI